MAKLKVCIDSDIDFGVMAWVEAFGFQTAFSIRRKKAKQGAMGLSEGSIKDLFSDDVSEPNI